MKKYTAFIVFIFLMNNTIGQDKKDLTISLSTGLLNSPYYNKSRTGAFYGFGADYYISKKQLLSVNYFAGHHNYFDNILSNTPALDYSVYPGGTNAKATYNTFSVSYKYKIVNKSNFSVVPGAGAGIMTHSRDYPYTHETTMDFRTSSWSDLVFPVMLDMNYKLFEHWHLGLTGGFLTAPTFQS